MKRYDNNIYVLSDNRIVKIGRSVNVQARLKSHKTSNPNVKLIKFYEAPEWGEKYIHKRLKHKLVQGCTEWFHYYDDIYKHIDSLIKEILVQDEANGESFQITKLRLRASNKNPRVFKFKDVTRDNYAFIVTWNIDRAFKAVRYISPVNVKLIEERNIDALPPHPDGSKDYIYMSTLRTHDEEDFCLYRRIDFNKNYGINTERQQMFMTKPMEEVFSKSPYKNSVKRRRY